MTRRTVALLPLAVLPLAVVLAGCGSAQQTQQSNEFVDALNGAQTELVSVTSELSAARTPEQFSAAIDEVLPTVEDRMAAVESAQQQLPGDLQPVGQACVDAMQTVIDDMRAVGQAAKAAAKSQDPTALTTSATTLQKAGNAFESDCVTPYNNAVGAN